MIFIFQNISIFCSTNTFFALTFYFDLILKKKKKIAAPAVAPSGDTANISQIEVKESNIDNSVLRDRVRGPGKRAPPSRRGRAARK